MSVAIVSRAWAISPFRNSSPFSYAEIRGLRVVYRSAQRIRPSFDTNRTPTRSEEHRIEPLGRSWLHVRSNVRVGTQGLRDVRVSQYLLHYLGVFAVLQHQGRCRVPESVERYGG